jgi:hypothetical protein
VRARQEAATRALAVTVQRQERLAEASQTSVVEEAALAADDAAREAAAREAVGREVAAERAGHVESVSDDSTATRAG